MLLATIARWCQQLFVWAHSSLFSEPWFQNLVLVVTAGIGILTFRSSSQQERRRATVDIVRDQQRDDVLIKARATVRSLEDASGRIDFGPILQQKDSEQLRAIYNVLNSYEFIASGLRTGAFDEKTYKRMYYNTVITHWTLFQDFIDAYREKYRRENPGVKGMAADTIYQDFQELATEWSKHPLKQIRHKKKTKDSGSPTTPPPAVQPPVQQQQASKPEALASLPPNGEKQQPPNQTGA